MTEATPLRIAVLMNGFESACTGSVKASFNAATAAASPSLPPKVEFFDPIIVQIYPDPALFDLIVLSGGTADPMGADDWVLKLQKYLRETVKAHPKQKLVGICWGHQTMHITFGGGVASMDGPEIGVTSISLTEKGKEFFEFATESGTMSMHEFHRREVKEVGNGFVPLADGNQCFLNEENTILTFQGHPELNVDLAKMLLENAPRYMGAKEKDAFAKTMEPEHDGIEIWDRVLRWVRE